MTAKEVFTHKWKEGDLAFIITSEYSYDLGRHRPKELKKVRVKKVVLKDDNFSATLLITFICENKEQIRVMIEEYKYEEHNHEVVNISEGNKVYLNDIVAEREYKRMVKSWNNKLTDKIEKLNKLFVKDEK